MSDGQSRQPDAGHLQPLAARSPRGESDVIDPFVQRSAGGVLIELELNADHVGPRGVIDFPSLVESVALAVEDERVVAIGIGAGSLKVPLNVMLAG